MIPRLETNRINEAAKGRGGNSAQLLLSVYPFRKPCIQNDASSASIILCRHRKAGDSSRFFQGKILASPAAACAPSRSPARIILSHGETAVSFWVNSCSAAIANAVDRVRRSARAPSGAFPPRPEDQVFRNCDAYNEPRYEMHPHIAALALSRRGRRTRARKRSRPGYSNRALNPGKRTRTGEDQQRRGC